MSVKAMRQKYHLFMEKVERYKVQAGILAEAPNIMKGEEAHPRLSLCSGTICYLYLATFNLKLSF